MVILGCDIAERSRNILNLVPVGWFSADMNVFSDGVLLAELQFSRWRENGSIVSESRHYAVHKDGRFSNRLLLEVDGRSYCRAQREDLLDSNSFDGL